MKLAILAEKPFTLQKIEPIFREIYSEDVLYSTFVCYPMMAWYSGSNNRYMFPRGIKWSDYPFVGDPQFRKLDFMKARAHWGFPRLKPLDEMEKGLSKYELNLLRTESQAVSRLREVDKIILLMDPDEQGFHLGAHFLSENFDVVPWNKVSVVKLATFTDSEMRAALHSASEPNGKFFEMVGSVKMKRYFDYNYLINSFALTAHRPDGFVPSKYGLQALYAMRRWGQFSHGTFDEKMTQWAGTGKYTNNIHGMGSATSRAVILEALEKAQFVVESSFSPSYYDEKTERMKGGKVLLKLSDLGHRYLDSLHPSCEDADLPFRLDAWSKLPEVEAKAKIDRYIRTFFGKQKNHLDRCRSSRE
jgi:hypothetical protein